MPGKNSKHTLKQQTNPEVIAHHVFTDSKIPKWLPWLLIVFTALLYSKACFNGFTSFDDDFYIINNPFLRDFSWHGVVAIFTSFYSGNYHPLTSLIHLLEYQFFGLNPVPYHTLNVLLHIVNTWLVYKVADRFSGNSITAIIVASLFAIHPFHVESVAWISELKDVLYALFYLLAILFYQQYLSANFNPQYYTKVLLLFAASLLSKSAAVTLPVLLLAIDLYKGRSINKRALTEKIPFFILSLIFGIIAIKSQRAGGAYNGLMISYGAINTVFLFTSGLAFYFLKLFAPFNLSIIHNFPELHNGFLPWQYYTSLPVVLLIAFLVTRRNNYKKDIYFGIAFFLITISVMLQVVSVGSALTSERYTYIPYIGLFYIVGQWFYGTGLPKYKSTTLGLLAVIFIVFSVQVWNRLDVWKDDMSLFNDLVEKNPDFYYGYWLKGNVEKRAGNLPEALNDYTKSISINSTFEDAYYNRGRIYDDIGDVKSAILDYSQSIKLNSKQADAYNNRGWAYYRTGDKQAAIADYNKAIELKRDYTEAYNNRGWAYDQSGNIPAALKDYTTAIEQRPDFDKPIYNRAALKARTGDFRGAVTDYTTVLQLHPDDAAIYYFRGLANLGLNNMVAACNDWKKANTLGYPKAASMLAVHCN